MKYIVSDHEIGLLYRDNIYQRHLPTGVYRYFSRRYSVILVDKRNNFGESGVDVRSLLGDDKLMALIEVITVKDHEVAFYYRDDEFTSLLHPGTFAYFKGYCRHTFTVCNTTEIEVPASVSRAVLNDMNFRKITRFDVHNGNEGALFCNGKFLRMLQSGQYWFFTNCNAVEVREVDLKIRMLSIAGQELLTSDKVDLRINFTLTLRITDSLKAATLYKDYDEQIYLLFQLALREYVASRTLDELLAQKHEIGKIILDLQKKREQEFGAEFIEAGIKDVILPGDVKAILNTVLIAEKQALANVITRREETASTRSLLNTAKLMDENKTLYRLKELEYLEHICDKVGSISLSNNGSVIEQLSQLIKK